VFKVISSLIIVIIVAATFVFVLSAKIRKGKSESQPRPANSVQITLYRRGTSRTLDDSSPVFKEVLSESERLLFTADDAYQFLVDEARIAAMKRREVALEVVYSEIQTVEVTGNTYYLTKLLVPLTGEFGNGTVFYAGVSKSDLEGRKPEYSMLSYNLNAHNPQGIDKLKQALERLGIRSN
jgi:hypothetical protein